MSRPAPIVWFELMVLASVAWGLIDLYLGYDAMAAMGAEGAAFTTWLMSSLFALVIGLSISRLGSRTTRWVLTILTALALPFSLANQAYLSLYDWAATFAPVIAMVLIWQKSVTAWMNDRPQPSAA